MELIIGGAYQGKLSYAREKYGLSDEDIFTCEGINTDASRRCVRHLEEYILACVRAGKEPELSFRPDAVVICRDVSCGVVPLEADLREWREAVGRALIKLSREAESVTRVFCGIPQRLK